MKKLIVFLPAILFLLSFQWSNTTDREEGFIDVQTFKKLTSIDELGAYYQENICNKKVRFELVRVAKKQDPVMVIGRAYEFSERILKLTQQATVGDIFYLDRVTTICEGEEIKLSAKVFKITAE